MTNHEIIRTLKVLIHANEDRQRKAEAEALQSILDIFEQTDPDTVSRQAVIELIQGSICDLEYSDENMELCDKVRALPPSPTPSRTTEPQWIPVTERMPEHYKQVLFCDEDGDIYLGCYSDKSQWVDSVSVANVVAWVPLPETYHNS